jgi:formylglycine-generating enzyme required for sulfatase activity
VSERRYRRCVASGACAPPVGRDRDSYLADTADSLLPATGMARESASDFCAAAGGLLPTEAEWEYAARPDPTLVYPWGTPIEQDRSRCLRVNARYPTSGAAVPCQVDALGGPRLVAVDAYMVAGDADDPYYVNGCARTQGAATGSHDGPCQMAGNVWEWTDSDFAPYPGASGWPPVDGLVVIRGGSADSLDYSLQTTFRFGIDPGLATNPGLARFVGFRCIYPD